MSETTDTPSDKPNKPESDAPSKPKAPSEPAGGTGKVTFFGQPAWVVIGGLAVIAVIAVLAVQFTSRGVPSDAIASVDGNAIPIAEFNKLASQSAKASGGVVPDPPAYTKCIAGKKKESPKLSNNALKTSCENDWNQMKESIVTALVQREWFELEAEDRGIEVTDKDVQEYFQQAKSQAFKTDKEYKEFLKTSGQSEKEILTLLRGNLIQQKVQQEAMTSPTPSTSQVKAEYEKNKDQYATPASRDFYIVSNSNKAKVDAAKAALASGDSWKDVAKRFSEDPASKENGGKMTGFTKGSQPGELDKAVFEAKKGQVVGPIKSQYGYYLIEVTSITEGKQQSLEQAKTQIQSTLQQQGQQTAQENFKTDFEDKWRSRTRCAEDFKVPAVCGNTKKPKEEEAPAGAGQPQGGQPQGGPPPQ